MKTQLLEDIGENTASSLAPSTPAGQSNAARDAHKPAPAVNAQPARPRSALGVWRQAPAGEAPASTVQQPDPQPAPLDLNNVFEEIAALEAQYVAPLQPHEPATAPAEPEPALRAPSAEPLHDPVIAPAGPTLHPDPPAPADPATVPHDPLFDFTLPSPDMEVENPFARHPVRATRSRQRHVLWAACLLAGALLILGGRWFYQQQVEHTVQPQAIAEKEPAPAPAGDAQRKPVEPAEPGSRPASSVPSLVYLQADPPPPAKPEQPASPAASPAEPRTAPKPAPAAEQARVYPIPKRANQQARERTEAAGKQVKVKAKAEPAPPRQLARTPAVVPEKRSGPDTSMEATLKACREHGYHAAQCVKRDCRVTEYGFVCRGR